MVKFSIRKDLKKSLWFLILIDPILFFTGLWTVVNLSKAAPILVPFALFFIAGFISLVVSLWHGLAKDVTINPDKN